MRSSALRIRLGVDDARQGLSANAGAVALRTAARQAVLEVWLSGPQPTIATVDGNGGLDLTFAPPLWAWSRYLPYISPGRQVTRGSDFFRGRTKSGTAELEYR